MARFYDQGNMTAYVVVEQLVGSRGMEDVLSWHSASESSPAQISWPGKSLLQWKNFSAPGVFLIRTLSQDLLRFLSRESESEQLQ